MTHFFIGLAAGCLVKEALVFVIRWWARLLRRKRIEPMTGDARIVYLATRGPLAKGDVVCVGRDGRAERWP